MLDMPDGQWSARFGSYEYACRDLPRDHALRVSAAAGRIVRGSIISVLVACQPGREPLVRYTLNPKTLPGTSVTPQAHCPWSACQPMVPWRQSWNLVCMCYSCASAP